MANDVSASMPRDGDCQPLITAALEVVEIGRARREVAAYLEGHECPQIDAAVLVASELITNAVIHGDGAARIEVYCNRAAVHIAVHDSSTAHPVVLHDDDRIGGRGVRIVEQLATRWGISTTTNRGGKDVWAIVPCTAFGSTDQGDGTPT